MKTIVPVIAMLFIGWSAAVAQCIQPEDLEYQGAFRLPDYATFEHGWYWGGSAATYFPHGDPSGAEDGYPGSIFGVGHDWNMYVSEVNIPAPVISPTKDLSDLPCAKTLQVFTDVRDDLFRDGQGNPLFYEIIRVGMEYLPPQGSQTSGKLHLSWGQHYQEDRIDPSHMWCETDLSDPDPKGEWFFGHYTNYVTNDYLFEIPEPWAAAHTPDQRLATGRYRDGLWGGRGPALFAYAPWQDEHPVDQDTLTDLTPLLLYGIQEPWSTHLTTSESMVMEGFKEADEWVGGAWLTAGAQSAVILAGTKGLGNVWYGLSDGTVWPDAPPYPDDPANERGWWCDGFQAQLFFFDPDDLADVADGTNDPWEPQPYASLNIDPYLFGINSDQQKHHICAVCYDRTRNHLFILERLVDDDKPLVHVCKVQSGTAVDQTSTVQDVIRLDQNYPNPFNASTQIRFDLQKPSLVRLTIFNLQGRKVEVLISEKKYAGKHTIEWIAEKLPSGVYVVRLEAGHHIEMKKLILQR